MRDFEQFFKGKKITVMGLGLLGGIGDIRFLAEAGADLIVTDLKNRKELKPSLDALKKFKNIRYTLGGHSLADFKNRDLIIRAPGTPLDSPYIAEAGKNNIPITMWAALFSQFAEGIGAVVVGITGTRGKTTVATIINEILITAGEKVIFGGNVQGTSMLSNLPKLTPDTIVVLELDSWKLQGFADLKISPNISVFTTFLPDHLNYYGRDMKKYFNDKASIFKYQKKDSSLIVGKQALPFIKKWQEKSKERVKSKIIVPKETRPKGWKFNLPGLHNEYNAMLAVEVARKIGIKNNVIKKALEKFKGVPGRLEFVREVKDVKYYNDTTATTPEATIAALKALGSPQVRHVGISHMSNLWGKRIILICGGSEKGLNMSALVKEIPKYCKKVILLSGSGTKRIKNKIENAVEVNNMKRAVTTAKIFTKSGDIILLSPAFASFGMFNNEYDRGDQFMKIVKKLK
jgi:UDP-N-acetylmuramoylalanine--D-glutamate ligase